MQGLRVNNIHNRTKQISAVANSNAQLSLGFAIAATFITVLSQISATDLTVAFGGLWLLVAVLIFKKAGGAAVLGGYSIFLLLSFLIYGLACSLFAIVFQEMGYVTGLFTLLVKICFVYIVGIALAVDGVRAPSFKLVICTYVIASLLYAVWVQVNYVPSLSVWMSNEEYLFPSKNSFGQIAGVTVCLLAFLPVSRRWMNIVKIPVAGYLLFLIAMTQCRTALIACFCAAVACLAYHRRWKLLVTIVLALIAIVIFVPALRSFVAHTFLLDKYENASLNTMSNGRLELWSQAFAEFAKSPIAGTGDYYVDNMYLNVLANSGLVGFVVFACGFIARLAINGKRAHELMGRGVWASAFAHILLTLSVFYLVESLLEGNPPYGPGTCSFMFWMICGYVDERQSLYDRSQAIR